jgi:hypothetical protein
VIVPDSLRGTNCVLDELQFDENTRAVVNGLNRRLHWFGLGFFLVMERQQLHMANVFVLAVILCGVWQSTASMGHASALAMADSKRIKSTCWDSVVQFHHVIAMVSVLIVLLVATESRVAAQPSNSNNNSINNSGQRRNGTTEEQRPIVVASPIKRSGYM